MLDEETVEYGVCLILAGFVKQALPVVWDEEFRRNKEGKNAGGLFDETMLVNGHAWLASY